jgi:hypothetical protein
MIRLNSHEPNVMSLFEEGGDCRRSHLKTHKNFVHASGKIVVISVLYCTSLYVLFLFKRYANDGSENVIDILRT